MSIKVANAARIVIGPRKQHQCTPKILPQKTRALQTLSVRPRFASRIASLEQLVTIPRGAPDSKTSKTVFRYLYGDFVVKRGKIATAA
jgi:hypothetical protein